MNEQGKLKVYKQISMGVSQNGGSSKDLGQIMLQTGAFTPGEIKSYMDDYSSMESSLGDTSQGIYANTKGGKQLESSQVENINNGDLAIQTLSNLESTFKEKKDFGGPVSGFFQGINPNEKATLSKIDSTNQIIGKFLEGGKLAEGDAQRYKEMLFSKYDTESERQEKLSYFKDLMNTTKNNRLDTYSKAGFDVSGFSGEETQQTGTQQQLSPEQAKEKVLTAYRDAKANPDNPEAQKFIEHFKAGHFDMQTGKLKSEFREKTEEEIEMEEIYGKQDQPQQPQEQKGFFGNLKADIQLEKTLKEGIKTQEELGKKADELNKQFQDLNTRLRETTDPTEKANLTQQKEELKKAMMENSRALIGEVTKQEGNISQVDKQIAQRGDTFGGALYEGVQDVADLGRDTGKNIMETGGQLVERGKGIIEAGKRGLEGEQGLGSTALQMAGEVGGGVADVIELGGKQFVDTLKATGKVLLPQGAEDYLGEKGKEEVNNALQSVANTETGKQALGWFMEKSAEWDTYKQENPTEARNIEAVGKIAEGVLAYTGLKQAGKVTGAVEKKGAELVKGAGEVIGETGGKLKQGFKQGVEKGIEFKTARATAKAGATKIPEGTILEGQKGAELLDKLKPEFTKKEKEMLQKSGKLFTEEKGKIKGLWSGTGAEKYAYTQYDKDVAKTVQELIPNAGKMNRNEITRTAKQEIENISNKLTNELKKVEIDPKKLQTAKDSWKEAKMVQSSDPNFSHYGGKKIQQDFENYISKVGVIQGNKLQNADELWSLAKKYDNAYKKIANYTGTDARQLYQKELWNENRKILRKSIVDAVESSNAPKETKDAFKKMSHLYSAIDNISTQSMEKGSKGIKGQVKDLVKNKIVQTGAGLAGAGYLTR